MFISKKEGGGKASVVKAPGGGGAVRTISAHRVGSSGSNRLEGIEDFHLYLGVDLWLIFHQGNRILSGSY